MIKGISDKVRFPRLGKIKIGEKTEKGYPRSLDYFLCPDEVKKVYGDEPKELDILFPVDSLDAIFPQYLKWYGKGSGLKCWGDGETAHRFNKETNDIEEIECLFEECPEYESKNCKKLANLNFMLPKVQGLGIYQLATSSMNSILNINSTLALISGITGGKISMIPFKLVVSREEAQVEGKKLTISVLNLRCEQFNLQKVLDKGAPRIGLMASIPAAEKPQTEEIIALSQPAVEPAVENLISDGQRKLFFARCNAKGIHEKDFRQYLADNYAIDSTAKIKQEWLDDILDWIEKYKK